MVNEFSSESLRSRRMEKSVSIAAELFLEHGIESVRMTDVAERSGVGVATLYRYFGTKTGLTIASMTYLWNELRRMFSGIFESEVFLSQTGLKQLTDLMRMYLVLHTAHRDFMRLLGEFDLFLIREGVAQEDLYEYEASIINFYPVVEKSFRTGCEDGTVRTDVDFALFYRTYTHALMELSKKLLQGEILPSDDFSSGEYELQMLIDTAVYFLARKE
ncbi:MAG: TetR/AcrR family transcriptional regulator [Oscillospiraceae bacterium]|nr:TetR/AcrR family transcriptional regulator [Oscillospiraceae bacterium]